MFYSGRLTTERIDQIAAVLRGEVPTTQPATTTQPAEGSPLAAGRSADEIAREREKSLFYDTLSERQKRELEDRQRLNLEIKLSVNRALDEIRQREERLTDEKQAIAEQTEMEGFQKQVTFLAKTEPGKAKDLMRNEMTEADVVRLMMTMDASRVTKIINECKTDDELNWIGRILNQIGQTESVSTAGVDGPRVDPLGG